MALQLRSAVTINALGTEVYIEFLEATGEYHEEDNPGGFGTDNPARNVLAILLYAVHQRVGDNIEASILTYNPLSVASFTVNIIKDVNGVLNYNLFALPIFDSGGVYEDGNIVFDNENPTEPFIKEMVEGEWEVRTADQLVGNENVIQMNDYTFAIPHAIILSRELNAAKMKKLRQYVHNECHYEDYKPARDSFEYVEGLLKSATNAFCAQAYNEAQIDVEEVFNYEESLVENE